MDRHLTKLVYRLTPALALALPVAGCGESAIVEQSRSNSSAQREVLAPAPVAAVELAEPRGFPLVDVALPIELCASPDPVLQVSESSTSGIDHSTVGHHSPAMNAGPALNLPMSSGSSLGPVLSAPQEPAASRPLAQELPPIHAPIRPQQQLQPSVLHETVTKSTVSPEAGTVLPWASDAISTPEMDAVSSRADGHISRGVDLAQRGATFSARNEFVRGLEMIAAALDTAKQTRAHTRALAAGLQALQEAEGFIPPQSQLAAELNLSLIVGTHQTPVLKNTDLSSLTPTSALQNYYTYAREQLTVAVGKQAVGSKGLYALGRLQTLPGRDAADWTISGPKAVVFYQAALAADPANAIAANELGVLLARFGRYPEAKNALLHAAMTKPDPAAWHNLAIIHRQFGENELAARAEQESKLAANVSQTISKAGGHSVQWVDAQQFAQTSKPAAVMQPAAAESKSPTTAAAAGQPKKTASSWFPWMKSGPK